MLLSGKCQDVSCRFRQWFVPYGADLTGNYLKGFCHGKVELLAEVLVFDVKFIRLNALCPLT